MSAPAPLRIPYVNLAAQYASERAELLPLIDRALASGQYIDGPAVAGLEGKLAGLCGVKHVVALNSGTDALVFALRALNIGAGDEVITPPNSFVASTAAIVHVGARPIFADVLTDQNIDPDRIDQAITPRTKAIMPVHLTGRICDMTPIMQIAQKHGLFVVEDAAQSIGSTYDGRPAGSFGDIGCFSAHPLKNLAALGDAGFVTTNDDRLAERIRHLRNHGLVNRNTVESFGFVSRLDTLQAVALEYRLGRLDQVIKQRRHNAALYRSLLDADEITVPQDRQIEFNTYHTFVIQIDRRDELQFHLAQMGIGSAIHYPVPIHLQPAAAALGYGPGDFPVTELQAQRILSLPINQSLEPGNIEEVTQTVNSFVRRKG